VHANPNFPKNVKIILKPQRNASESTIDVQEDVWEKHVELVQDMHATEDQLKRIAEVLVQEDAENFIAQEDTENLTEKNTENLTEKEKLWSSKEKSLKRNWKHIAEKLQKENVEMIKNAESE